LRRHKEALAYLDRVLEMRPNHIDALLARGEVYMDLGDDKNAMKDFNEVNTTLTATHCTVFMWCHALMRAEP
ncbi:tetratricopeptide repeat protein, partial [Escherichia coli]|uniref:tetratricopeptide repeat protein n=1 Tax=Escherichia coli TaxID=562 RepID=UPI0028DECFC5